MDNLLKEFFGVGDEPEAAPAAAQAAQAAPAAAAEEPMTDRQKALAEQREARREARRQRKADPDRKRNRDEFVERYATGNPSEGFTAEEALAHLAEMRDELSPAEFQVAMVKTLDNLPVDQRDEFIAIMRKHKDEAAKAAPAAATAAAAAGAPAAATADPFGGLLTGLFGGGRGAGAAGAAGGVDVGSLLNDLQKGGLGAPSASGGGKPTEADFMELINSPLGKAVLGGLAAYGMQAVQADDDDHDTPSGKRTRG